MKSPESDSLSTGGQSIRPLSPLDPAEDLRREDILAGDRGEIQLQRQPGSSWRRLTPAELAAVMAIPALVALGIVLGESGAPPAVALISISLLIVALAAFAVAGRRPRA